MRKFYKVSDLDETNQFVIPRTGYIETFAVPHKTRIDPVIGFDGGFDQHGSRRAPLAQGAVTIDFDLFASSANQLLKQADVLTMLQGFEGATEDDGLRKLWRQELYGHSDPRFTWARTQMRPTATPMRGGYDQVSVEMGLPDPRFYRAWDAAEMVADGFTALEIGPQFHGDNIEPYDDWGVIATVTAATHNFTLTNAGDVESRQVIFRLESVSSAGFTAPVLQNLTTGQQWSSTRTATSTSDILQVNAGPGSGRAQFSNDSGLVWTSDMSNLLLGSQQGSLMKLVPGANSMRLTPGGTENVKLLVFMLHAYRD